MKTATQILRVVLILTGVLLTGCSRHKIIPDSELADIFHDVFLANAYTSNRDVMSDSLNIYEPIFTARGYTTDDVQYTIGNFSKRKSARLGDVVERAIARLEQEGLAYNREVAILDTIDNIAQRTFSRTIFSADTIRVRKLGDTTRLKMRFKVHPGEYTINFDYLVDSMDRNHNRDLSGEVWLERADKSRSSIHLTTWYKGYKNRYSRFLRADTTHRYLCLDLLRFRHKAQKPSMTLWDFSIHYTPEKKAATDSLFIRQLNLRIFSDEFLRLDHAKDSF